jgi:FkbM family methyltransferase
MTFYSQCGEDKIIYEKYFKDKTGGVFLELGAMDGVQFSNTKFFEDMLGWSGVLIEPHPDTFKSLQANRPKSKCYNCAVSCEETDITMLVNPYNSAVSAIENTAYGSFKYGEKGWHEQSYKINVKTRRLDHILKDAGISHIDFFSLDVEGHEYEVLKSMDWSIPVKILLIEAFDDDPNKENIRSFLVDKGFAYDGICAHNQVWVNSNPVVYS